METRHGGLGEKKEPAMEDLITPSIFDKIV